MKLDSSRSLLIRLFILAVVVLVAPMTLISLRAMGEFEQGMNPEMDKKAAAIGRDVAAQVDRAVGYGIPVDKLVGVEEFFAPVLTANPEIRYLAITDKIGRVLFLRGAEKDELEPHYQAADLEMSSAEGIKASIGTYLDLALPVAPRGNLIAHVHVGFDQGYVVSKLHDILYDVLVVMAASLIIAFEILLFVVFFNVTGPLKLVGEVVERARHGDLSHVPGGASGDEVGRFVRAVAASIRNVDDLYRQLMAYIDEVRTAHFDKGVVEKVGDVEARISFQFRFSNTGKPLVLHQRRATDIRLPLFLFVFAEELSRAFMPLYVREVGQSLFGLSPEMIMALPIAVFMACIALASPFSSRLIDRLGARRVFLIGLVPAIAGYVMTGAAVGVIDLVLWRAITGLGYALVTMACQSYILGANHHSNRSQGMGVFVGAVLTASICGTAMGGVLAERVGFRATFFVSAVLVLLAGIVISHMLDSAAPPAAVAPQPRRNTMRLFTNWRFSVLMLFAAVPSKMALTGFLFFLVPVILTQGDWQVAEIARMVVLYPLVMVVVLPLAARLAEYPGWRIALVALGGLIGGGGLLTSLFLPSELSMMIAIAALGLSHGLSASPQLAMIPDLCWTECRNMGQTNVLAFVRLVERIGSTVGPLLAAAFIPVWGVDGAVVALGGVVLAMAVLFAGASLAYGTGPHIEAEEDLA
ncbi:MAG: MFS transporter [Rhodospirillaceae bacterium]|nr:MFS transporter [Rhodospirillales bacterium]